MPAAKNVTLLNEGGSLRRTSDQLRRMSVPDHLRVFEEIKKDPGDKWNGVTSQKP